MTTRNKSLLSQPAMAMAQPQDVSDYNRIEGVEGERPRDHADAIFAEARWPVPLYVIAAAALLG